MDIIQNSIAAQASKIDVFICVDKKRDILRIKIADNGLGIDENTLKRITSPFVTTRNTRQMGMGIPLFKASAKRAGGDFRVASHKGGGTVVEADFEISHIDRPPLGDIAQTLTLLIATGSDIEYGLILDNKSECFIFNSLKVKKRLGAVPITSFEVLDWISAHINEGTNTIFGGVLNEILG